MRTVGKPYKIATLARHARQPGLSMVALRGNYPYRRAGLPSKKCERARMIVRGVRLMVSILRGAALSLYQ